LLHALDRTSSGLAPAGTHELGSLIGNAAGTFGTLARSKSDLGSTIDELRPLEDEVLTTLPIADPLLVDLTTLSRRLTPALANIRSALPSVNALLRRSDDLRELPRLARALDPVVRRGRPLIAELLPNAQMIGPLARRITPFVTALGAYTDDLRVTMEQYASFTGNRYAEGQASGEKAARFTPIFTCHRTNDPYPAPNVSITQRTANLAEACR
jgi:ABC-type transporter Mla subunit MlaD